jgi:nitrite reductase/ring-hydroxylating ferredoxin subunit
VKYEVMPSGKLAPGEMATVVVGGSQIAVVRAQDGSLHALRDRCPHQGAALSGGRVEEMIVGNVPGEYALAGSYIVRCPWHQFEFDVTTGICPVDPRQRVRAFTVSEDNGMIVVER